jgi:hypothetical protein
MRRLFILCRTRNRPENPIRAFHAGECAPSGEAVRLRVSMFWCNLVSTRQACPFGLPLGVPPSNSLPGHHLTFCRLPHASLQIAKPFWVESDQRKDAWLMLGGVIVMSLATTGISVGFNFLGRDFFNAISTKARCDSSAQLWNLYEPLPPAAVPDPFASPEPCSKRTTSGACLAPTSSPSSERSPSSSSATISRRGGGPFPF